MEELPRRKIAVTVMVRFDIYYEILKHVKKRGDLSRIFEEALELWLKERERE